MKIPSHRLAGCALALTLSLASPALAQTPAGAPRSAVSHAEREQLTRDYQTAQEHYLAKRYTEALPIFRRVAERLDSPNAWLYVARSLVALDRPAEAYRAMHKTTEVSARRSATEPRFGDTLTAAKEELALIEKRIVRLAVTLRDAPPDALLEINGSPIAAAERDSTVAVRPGRIRIEARAAGRTPLREELQGEAGSQHNVLLRFAAEAAAAPLPAAPTAAEGPAPSSVAPDPAPVSSEGADGSVRILGFVVAGLGAAGWITFAAAASSGEAVFDDLAQQCNFTRCTDPATDDEISKGRTLDVVAHVGLGVGIAGTIAGALMIALGGADDAAATTGFVAPSNDGGGWAGMRGSF